MEQNSMWQNREDQGVKEDKQKDLSLSHKKGTPRNIWDLATVYAAELIYLTAFPNTHLRKKDNSWSFD